MAGKPSAARFDADGNLVVNHERWARVADAPDRWHGRYVRIAALLRPGERIVEFGCSGQAIRALLPEGCRYQPADLIARSPDCIAIDLTTDSPASIAATAPGGGRYDTAIYAGVLEYLPDPVATLAETMQIADRAIFSYALRDQFGDMDHRVGHAGWFSRLSLADLQAGAGAAGLALEPAGTWQRQRLFVATPAGG